MVKDTRKQWNIRMPNLVKSTWMWTLLKKVFSNAWTVEIK